MGWVHEWLEATACPMLDRDQDERVQALAREMGRLMLQEGRFFSLRETTANLAIEPRDLPFVQDRLYELTLRYVLQSYAITSRDRSGLNWVAKTLHLDPERARRIELRVGRRIFEQYLAFAISGGFLDDEELEQLRTVAGSLDVTTRHLMSLYLAESGEEFLERILNGLAEDGQISDASWDRLLASTSALGLELDEFLRLLTPHTRRLAQRVRNTVRPDGQLDTDLRPPLQSLLSRFPAFPTSAAS